MYIISIKTDSRLENISEVQEVLTKYGKNINTRLGVHNPAEEDLGLIIITYVAENVDEVVEELNSISDVVANFMKA